jgi:hypothetical protein
MEFVHVRRGLDLGQYGFARHRAIGSAGPGHRHADQRLVRRLHHASGKVRALPTRHVRGPLLQLDVAEAPLLELAGGPLFGGPELRGIRQTRSVAVGQVVHDVHDPGRSAATTTESSATTEFGDLDLVDRVQVYPLLRYDKQWNEQKKRNNKDGFS